MVKYELRKMGFSVHERRTKKFMINILWIALAVFIIIGTVILALAIIRLRPGEKSGMVDVQKADFIIGGSILVYMLEFIIAVFVWLGLKFAFTFLFCSDRLNSVKLKILEGHGMPVCYCREALKPWQTIVIYAAPAVIIYLVMLLVGLIMVPFPFQEIETGFITMLFFMTFFLAWDLTLAIYVLAIKIKDKIEYIAIDRHIYEITLYKSTYIRLGKRASKKRVEIARQKRNTRLFTKMTTCANINCENYSQDLGDKTKICGVCGNKTYIAEVFEHVITCVNEQCENYGHELKNDLKFCPNCGEDLKNLAFKFRPDLTKSTVIITLAFTAVFIAVRGYLANYYGMTAGIPLMILDLLQFIAFAVCMTRGWVSKNIWVFLLAAAAFLFLIFGLGWIL